MPDYIISKDADDDLLAIASYTVKRFGETQALRYLEDLKLRLLQVSKRPELGRDVFVTSLPLKRFNFKAHVVFYQILPNYILIVRVLHKSMEFDQYL